MSIVEWNEVPESIEGDRGEGVPKVLPEMISPLTIITHLISISFQRPFTVSLILFSSNQPDVILHIDTIEGVV